MAKNRDYTFRELVEIYGRYAKLKGWSTKESVIRDKVESWIDQSIGPVGLAIEFFEQGSDGAKHLGHDAEARARNAPIQYRLVTIAGTQHANRDGTNRQAITRRCEAFEVLRLEHEPENEFDSNAIGVYRKTGEQLGYLPRRLAADMVGEMEFGYNHAAVLESIKPGKMDVLDFGSGRSSTPDEVVIALFAADPDVSAGELRGYCREWIASAEDDGETPQ